MRRLWPLLSRLLSRLLSPLLGLLLLAACTPAETGSGALVLSLETIDFGAIQVGATAYQGVSLSNAGDAELRILSVAVVDGDRAIWEIEKQGAPTLAPGESTEVTFRFSPFEPGEQEGRVRIRSDDPDRAQVDVALTGATRISDDDLDGDGFSPADGDCDDDNRMTWPGAQELCDGQDNDCDGTVPVDEADEDADGWRICEGDCDDEDQSVRPGRAEICDGGKDTDCDGVAQDYLDEDGDGWSLCASDCDDAQPLAHPTAEEVCDGIDNDCNGVADDIDRDGDGRGACPGAGDCDDTDPSAYGQVVDGSAAPDGDGSTDAPFDDILDAIAHVDEICRTVVVRPGSYELSRTWSAGFLRIEGAGDSPDAVLISPPIGSRYRVFTLRSGAMLELSGLLFRDANGDGDGGIIQATDADLRLEDVVFFDNRTDGNGAAISMTGGSLLLERVELSSNLADGAGGAISAQGAEVRVWDSIFAVNSAQRGGAMHLQNGDLDAQDSLFDENEALLDGGAIDLLGDATFTLLRLDLRGNLAGADGGAVHLGDLTGDGGALHNSRIQDNSAGQSGGGLAITGAGGRVRVANNSAASNDAVGAGGAFALDATDGSGLFLWSNLSVASGGSSAIYARSGGGASVGWNSVAGASGTAFDIGVGEDAGNNDEADPLWSAFSDDGDPRNDRLVPASGSPAIDSGPPEGAEAGGWTRWLDADGSSNDRGMTGGPEAP